MINLHCKPGLLGEGQVHHVSIPSARGLTARRLLEIARHAPQMRRHAPLGVAVNGRRLKDRELDIELPDGAEVVVASPQQGIEIGTILVTVLISALASAAVSYAASLLLPKPKPSGVPQDRGDQSSATYAWDGITTSYGQGLPVPFGYGRHGVGGQVIDSAVEASMNSADVLRVVLAIGEGPIWRVGDQLAGEQNAIGAGSLTPLPAEIRINDLLQLQLQTEVRAWIRSGELNQSPLPFPFAGAAVTVTIAASLDDENAEAVYAWTEDEEIGSIAITIAFPSGIYVQNSQGVQNPVTWPWRLEWRPAGDVAWRFLAESQRTVVGGQVVHQQLLAFASTAMTAQASMPPGVFGPIDIRLRREVRPSQPAGQIVDHGVWRQVTIRAPHVFAYPGVALLGLEVRANSQLQGSNPQFQVRCDMRPVRVWDESTGWSEPCWDVPSAPFNWMNFPPGRNPAWIALDFILNEDFGLGRWWNADQVDLAAFRRWSILCDSEPNPADPWGEAAFCVDFLADAPRPAWERLLQICSAGRATPVLVGSKLSVVYQYRDAHSDALVSVPAKTPVQLFTSSNVEDLQVTWLTRRNRATTLQYQFLNEARAYAQDVIPVEDPEGTQNDPNDPFADTQLPEPVQAYGVVRESQLLREGVFTHRLQRECTREVTFRTGPWSLASQVGDLFRLEHEVLRPFASDVPMSCTIHQAGVGEITMIVDHVVTGTGLRVVWRDPDGEPQEAAVVTLTALSGGRTEIEIDAPGSWVAGAPAVVGKVAKLTDTYQVATIGLAQEIKREVRGLQWTPDAFEPIGPDFFEGSTGEDGPVEEVVSELLGLSVEIEAMARGGHVLSWSTPETGGVARVWVRWSEIDAWVLLGETRGTSLETRALTPHRTYDITVAVEQRGAFRAPEQLDAVTITAPEFPRLAPPPCRRLRAEQVGAGVLFSWPAQGRWDLWYYELRAGQQWVTAKPVYRGQLEEVWLAEPPADTKFWLAARSISGLYGDPATVVVASWSPEESLPQAHSDELASTPPGTLDGLAYDGSTQKLAFAAAALQGSYVAEELDPGYVAPWRWQVRCDHVLYDDLTVGEETGTCGDGEAAWSTCACRPPSVGMPGLAIDDGLVGDDVGLIGDDSPLETAAGGVGEVGTLGAVILESRYHDGVSWGDWTRHVDGEVVSRKIQVRARLERAHSRMHVELTELQATAFL